MPFHTIEKLAFEQGMKRTAMIDQEFQKILKAAMPLRFAIMNKIKSRRLVKLFGVHLEVQGDFHTVKLHGKVIGSFTA